MAGGADTNLMVVAVRSLDGFDTSSKVGTSLYEMMDIMDIMDNMDG
jgi:hypothetical protein